MCLLCSVADLRRIRELKVCSSVKRIPTGLINLHHLDISFSQISSIPNDLIKLKTLKAGLSYIEEIPKELINLKNLDISCTQVSEIPKELIKLEKVDISFNNTIKIYKLPNLRELNCSIYLANSIMSNICDYPKLRILNSKSIFNTFIYNLIKYESNENCYICLESGIKYKCCNCSFLVHRTCIEKWIANNAKRECCQCKLKFK